LNSGLHLRHPIESGHTLGELLQPLLEVSSQARNRGEQPERVSGRN
jgi:hypothetical protein